MRHARRRHPDPALREVAGDAAVYAEPGELADGVRRALAERDRLVAAGLERASAVLAGTRRRALDVYRDASTVYARRRSAVTGLGRRRLARARGRARRSLPALAPQVDELVVVANVPGSVPAGRCTARAWSRTRGR